MNERDIRKEIIASFERTADLIDKHKQGYDLKFLEAVALNKHLEETGDVMELIRLSFNMGFFRGIGYQSDYARGEINEGEDNKESEHQQAQEPEPQKSKRGRRKSS